MRRIVITLAICAAASQAFAECPNEGTINAFGHTFKRGGLYAMLSDDAQDCNASNQPAGVAKANEAAPVSATPLGQPYCRKIMQSKDPQIEAQRRDCTYWYGHSIEAR